MLVPLTVVPNEYEAEMLCALLRTEGIDCDHRPANEPIASLQGQPSGGPREVTVEEHGLARAQQILETSTRPAG